MTDKKEIALQLIDNYCITLLQTKRQPMEMDIGIIRVLAEEALDEGDKK